MIKPLFVFMICTAYSMVFGQTVSLTIEESKKEGIFKFNLRNNSTDSIYIDKFHHVNNHPVFFTTNNEKIGSIYSLCRGRGYPLPKKIRLLPPGKERHFEEDIFYWLKVIDCQEDTVLMNWYLKIENQEILSDTVTVARSQ